MPTSDLLISEVIRISRNQIYLGDDSFVETLQAMIEKDVDLSEVPLAQKRKLAKPIGKYIDTADSRDATAAS